MTNGEKLLIDAKEMPKDEFDKKYQKAFYASCDYCPAKGLTYEECEKQGCMTQIQNWLNAEVPKEYPLSFIELFDFAYGTVFEGQKSNEVYSLGMHSLATKEIVSDRYRVISRSEPPSK